MIMPFSGTPGVPYFDGRNVTDFIKNNENMCLNHHVSEYDRYRRMPKYCEILECPEG